MSRPDRDIQPRPTADQPAEMPAKPTDEHDMPIELPERDAMTILSPTFGSEFITPYPGMPVDADE